MYMYVYIYVQGWRGKKGGRGERPATVGPYNER